MIPKQPLGLRELYTIRFLKNISFYGLRALFILYVTQSWFFTEHEATALYQKVFFFSTFLFILGGLLSDTLLKNKRPLRLSLWCISIGILSISFSAFFSQIIFMNVGLVIFTVGVILFEPSFYAEFIRVHEKSKSTDLFSNYIFMTIAVQLGAFLGPIISGTVGLRFGLGFGLGFVICILPAAIALILERVIPKVTEHDWVQKIKPSLSIVFIIFIIRLISDFAIHINEDSPVAGITISNTLDLYNRYYDILTVCIFAILAPWLWKKIKRKNLVSVLRNSQIGFFLAFVFTIVIIQYFTMPSLTQTVLGISSTSILSISSITLEAALFCFLATYASKRWRTTLLGIWLTLTHLFYYLMLSLHLSSHTVRHMPIIFVCISLILVWILNAKQKALVPSK